MSRLPSNESCPAIHSEPLISVVMPCYNVASTLADAVQSVLTQTHTNFELLLVNDGSTDTKTAALCDSFTSDVRVRVIHQKNKGLAGARNTGLHEARGEFIALLDADDLYLPDKLAAHLQHFRDHPEIGLSFSYSRFISDTGKQLPLTQGGRIKGIEPHHILCRNPIGNGSAAVLRSTALRDVAPPTNQTIEGVYFDPELRQSEDVEFWFRLATTTHWKVGGIDRVLTLYRLNNSGLSANTDAQLATWETFLTKASGYAASTVAQYGARARAYQLRYLSRRCLQIGNSELATRFLAAALREDRAILWQEPARTIATLAACVATRIIAPARQWFLSAKAEPR